MTYIITSPCIDVCDGACVKVCPVDCIYEKEDTELEPGDAAYKNMLYIHPEECIDCGACEPECPVDAIYADDEVPEDEQEFIQINYEAFGCEAP